MYVLLMMLWDSPLHSTYSNRERERLFIPTTQLSKFKLCYHESESCSAIAGYFTHSCKREFTYIILNFHFGSFQVNLFLSSPSRRDKTGPRLRFVVNLGRQKCGSVLFLVYVNDIAVGVIDIISKFVDDTKIANTIASNSQTKEMQNNLDKLSEWGQTWQMSFNENKCKVMHIGYQNEIAKYILQNTRLKNVVSKVDLGVTISNNLKLGQQCSEVINKASKILIFRPFEYKCKNTILTLYTSLVHPLLEYCIHAWCPYYQKSIEKLEWVQLEWQKLFQA